MSTIEIFTVGHSTHSWEQFLDLLQQHEIAALADIRRFPASCRHPQFDREPLSSALRDAGIEYRWIETLGGRRPPTNDGPSPNTALRNQSFRNYADYMLTPGFRQGMHELLQLAESKRTAIMCAESLFWRCHRRLVSDYLLANGGTVRHIFPTGEAKPHALTEGARVHEAAVTYPGQKTLFD